MKIYFNFDDGDLNTFKLVKLFEKYQLPVFLFIPKFNAERKVISPNDIKYINSDLVNFGAHTLNHIRLNIVDDYEILNELYSSKIYLEDILNKEIKHFCYPGGKYNSKSLNYALNIYKTVRTADTMSFHTDNKRIINPFFHFYNRGKKSLIFNSFKNNTLNYETFNLIYKYDYFDFLQKYITFLHSNSFDNDIIIFGHSWEITNYNLWKSLENLLSFISINFPYSVKNYEFINE
jgi:peptidoglycan/xylan/chitin deacetylase (PgdA/CDA1 family)